MRVPLPMPIDAFRRHQMSRTPRMAVALLAGTLVSACVHQPPRTPSSGVGLPPVSAEREPPYTALGSGHLIRNVTPDGQFVTLEDGSLWEVEPSDWFKTADWQQDASATVRPSGPVGRYSYELINTQDDEGALARYVPRR
jgi:hypothetical protein